MLSSPFRFSVWRRGLLDKARDEKAVGAVFVRAATNERLGVRWTEGQFGLSSKGTEPCNEIAQRTYSAQFVLEAPPWPGWQHICARRQNELVRGGLAR